MVKPVMFVPQAATSETRPRDSSPWWLEAAPTSRAAMPTSTGSFGSRQASSIGRNARRGAPGWRSRGSGSSRATSTRRRMRLLAKRLVLLKEFVENQADEPESVSAVLSWYWNQSLDKIQFDRIERKITHSPERVHAPGRAGSPARIAWS
jgi:hypothetical protein